MTRQFSILLDIEVYSLPEAPSTKHLKPQRILRDDRKAFQRTLVRSRVCADFVFALETSELQKKAPKQEKGSLRLFLCTKLWFKRDPRSDYATFPASTRHQKPGFLSSMHVMLTLLPHMIAIQFLGNKTSKAVKVM